MTIWNYKLYTDIKRHGNGCTVALKNGDTKTALYIAGYYKNKYKLTSDMNAARRYKLHTAQRHARQLLSLAINNEL